MKLIFHISYAKRRSLNLGDYRFGASNGQEMIDEISGQGNHYTAEFWEYNPRLARRWNLDPVDQISMSNYAVFRNNPIIMIDPDGDVATKYEDEDGNPLGETNDGNDATVTIGNENKERFTKEFEAAQDKGVQDRVKFNENWTSRFGTRMTFEEGDKVQEWSAKAIAPDADLNGLSLSTGGLLMAGARQILDGSSVRFFRSNGTKFSPKFYDSGWKGGSRGNIKTYSTSGVAKGLRVGGYGLGVLNAASIQQKYSSGQLSGVQWSLEQGSNAISTFGGLPGAAWGVGWEAGRAITETRSYQNWKQESWMPFRRRTLGY